ncbi:hypothetical protein D3C83_26630 [compost metagenome]
MPPTVLTIAILERYLEPPQRSTASVRALRTRTSSNGLCLWFGVMSSPQFQGLSSTVMSFPRAFTRSSRDFGGKLLNSIAARSPRIACTRSDSFLAKIASKPSR